MSEAFDDERITRYLAALDEAVVAGVPPPPFPDVRDPHVRARLEGIADTVRFLEAERVRAHLECRAEPGAVPSMLGRFRLIRTLGAGGFGVVYLAEDPLLGRQVALKVPRTEALVTDALRARFLREARLAGRLSHPHIVPIYDSGAVGPFCYLVSAYFSGGTLAEWLKARETAVPIRAAAELVVCLADGVQHAHERGVLHRDLKPTNIILEPSEQGPAGLGYVPRLTDFGLAKFLDEPGDDAPTVNHAMSGHLQPVHGEARAASALTRTNLLMGTPAYMAPEQAEGRRHQVGPATDVYGLGAILYELLTGQPPFRGATALAVLRQAVHDEPQRLARVRPGTPADLEAICLKCLEKQPERRYGSAQDLAEDLRRYLNGSPTHARPLSAARRLGRLVRRRPLVAALVAVVSLSILALVLGGVWHVRALKDYHDALSASAVREQAGAERIQGDLVARQHSYTANIALISSQWKNIPPDLLRTLLEQQRPAPGQPDPRDFVWWYLWDQARHVRHLAGHQGGVDIVALDRDGRHCLSVTRGGLYKSWDLTSGRLVGSRDKAAPVDNVVAVDPQGRRLLSAVRTQGAITALELWDREAGLVARKPVKPARDVNAALTPDGRHVAYTLSDKAPRQVYLWDSDTDAQRVLWSNVGGVNYLVFSPDGQKLALSFNGADDPDLGPMQIAIFETASGKELGRMRGGHRLFIFALSFSPDGATLASGSWDRQVILWDVRQYQEKCRLPIFPERIGSLTYSPDGKLLAVGLNPDRGQEGNGAVSLWACEQACRLKHHLYTRCGVAALQFHPNGKALVAGGRDGLVRIWTPDGPGEFSVLAGHTPAEAWSVAFAPDGKTLASAGDDHLVRLWDARDGKQVGTLEGHTSLVTSVAFAANGKLLASGSFDGTVKIWDPSARTLLHTCRGHERHVRSVAFSPDSRMLASAGRDNATRLWDADSGTLRDTLTGAKNHVFCTALSPDGAHVASGSIDGKVRVWNVVSRREVSQFDVGRDVYSVAISVDGAILATGDAKGGVKYWECKSGKELAMLSGHLPGSGVLALAFSPDGKTLASAGVDRSVRFWHARNGQEMLRFGDLPAQVNSVAFSPDSRTLAAALHDGSIRLWRAPHVE